MNKIKQWFKDNWKGFVISLVILIQWDVIPLAVLPKWILIIGTIIVYLCILGYKIIKNQPF